jgi:flagellar basal-body rod protein FlgB
MDILTNSSVPELTKVLDMLAERQRLISNNIANADTPGYKCKDVAFSDVLSRITGAKSDAENRAELEEQLQQIELERQDSGAGFDNQGLNDVDIEREMTKLATNTLLYKTYVSALVMKLKQIDQALK